MLRFLSSFILALLILGVAVLAAVTLYIVPGLPEIEALRDVRMQVPLQVYTADGSLIAEFGEKRRKPVEIEDVPRRLVDAFVAAEDDRFYQHPGVDWQGILRAVINLVRTGEKSQGGSTITMQVARNFFLSREKSYLRKLNEIFLALKIEQELEKDEILELYLNKIYLGQRAYGVGAAAQVYYGSTVQELTLAQTAMIAGLPKAPSSTNPVSNPERARARRQYVLQRMLDLGYITPPEFEQASAEPLSASLHAPDIEVEAPYVAEMVRKQMVERFGEDAYNAGYRVHTTVRDRHQTAANLALRRTLREYDERHGYRGAEQHVALAAAAGPQPEEEWTRLLQTFPAIGSLYPALIVEVQEQSAAAFLSGIGRIEIEWEGLKWARKYVTENVRGPEPKTAADVVQPGDVVRVVEDTEGRWRLSQIPALEGALVSLDPSNGATYALVGGFNFNRSKFNRAVQARRQPGSSFKPFVYSAALEAGFTAASVINDAPVVFDDPGIEDTWRPENYSGRYYGPTRLREALIHSRNLVSIRLLHAMGIDHTMQHVARFGFDTEKLPHNLSLALGSGAVTPLELATAYTVLANGGFRVEPYLIEKIETWDGRPVFAANPLTVCRECEARDRGLLEAAALTGAGPAAGEPAPVAAEEETAAAPADTAAAPGESAATPALADNGPADAAAPAGALDLPQAPRIAPRVVNPQNIWIMNSMTRDVVKEGTARRALELGRSDLSGKTGTTNDQRDAWFAGYNPHIVTISWVGFDKFEPLGALETGARAALPMWIDYMRVALQDIPEYILERPDGLINVRIDPYTGNLARTDNPDAIFEVFQAGTAPVANEDSPGLDIFFDKGESKQTPDQLF